MRRLRFSFAIALAACTAGEPVPIHREAAEEAVDADLELDRRGHDVLSAVVAPVLGHSDAPRTLTLSTTLEGGLGDALEGLEVLDARFVGFGVVLIDTEHALVSYDEAGNARVLDRDAWGPLSVAPGVVAYTHGSPPDLELRRAYASGVVEPLTTGMAPVWSPALSPDGREVVFVSGAAGLPRLHRRSADGALAALPVTARVPSAPSAPIWRGPELVFEDERGVVAVDLRTGDVLQALDDARAPAIDDDGAVRASLRGARVSVGGAR